MVSRAQKRHNRLDQLDRTIALDSRIVYSVRQKLFGNKALAAFSSERSVRTELTQLKQFREDDEWLNEKQSVCDYKFSSSDVKNFEI